MSVHVEQQKEQTLYEGNRGWTLLLLCEKSALVLHVTVTVGFPQELVVHSKSTPDKYATNEAPCSQLPLLPYPIPT